jgi:anti-sigma factor RsiW
MMNCETFHDLLHEYLDETLEARVQAAAHEHLRQCEACRRACLREQALAKSMGQTFARATAGLSVRPGLRQNVLQAMESEAAPAGAWRRGWHGIMSIRLWPAGAVAAILGVLLLFFGVHYFHRLGKDSSSQTVAQASYPTYVIHVPIQTQTHVFRRQDNIIEDAIVSSTSVGHASFFEDREQFSRKPSSNPL